MSIVPFDWGAFIVVLVVLIILGICLALFSTMTVTGDEHSLEIRLGMGVIRKNFPFNDIISWKLLKIPWYYGWGIRVAPHGWLYRVSGSHVVELQMKNGKRYLIGTDEPENLAKFLSQKLESHETEH